MGRSFVRGRSGVYRDDPPEGANVTADAEGSIRQPLTTVRSSCASRSGSASTSIATILPPLTVRARTANGLPSGFQATPPGIPLTRTRVDVSVNRRKLIACCGDGLRAADQRGHARTRRTAVRSNDDVGVEDGQQAVEVALARGGQERVDDGPLAVEVDVRNGRALDASTGPARELSGRRRRPADDGRDVVERQREHVVEDEGDAFGGRQGVEDDEQGEPDRIAEQRLLLGIEAVLRAHDRIREMRLQRRLAPRPARSQHVEADATDDRRQPGAQVLDLGRVGAAQADPGFLDGVVGLAHGAEHPEGDAAQVGAVGLEALGEPVLVGHRSAFLRGVGHDTDPPAGRDVTDDLAATSAHDVSAAPP